MIRVDQVSPGGQWQLWLWFLRLPGPKAPGGGGGGGAGGGAAVPDSLLRRFRYVPQPSEWGVVLLLLYTVASVLSLQCLSGSRPYAAYVLAIGSLLMTCQLTWHWGSHVAQFKDSLLVGQPFSPDMTIHYGNATGYPPSSSPLYGLAFGSSGPDFLDSAACLAVLFLNCVQSSFLCRLGTRITAIVSVLQWVVYACWPFMSADSRSAWLCRIGAMGLWTAHLIRSSYVWESELQQQSARIDKLQQAVAQTLRDLKDGRDADSVLNHVLKNTMADVMGCIDLCRPQAENECLLLSKASNMLFRGMWWCKLREAILELVAGRYETKQEVVDVQEFAQDLVRGREVTLECSSRMVKLDPMACNIVLDNALTNGKRHGYPGDPQVELSVEVVDQTRHEGAPAVPASHTIRIDGWDEHTDPLCVAPDDVRDPNTSCAIPVEVRFTVRNRANPARPLERPWSLEQPSEPLRKDPSRPTLSDGLGLQHISMAARSCGMHARLWQQDAEVHFELCLCTTSAAHAPVVRSAVEPLQKTCPFREGMKILCLDDSGITRQNLEMILTQEIPNATVTMYGKDPADVEEFKRDALAKGDILILDEHVDLPGPELRGSAILQELVAEGYQGFACIRSGDSTDADKVRSYKSGAHWHVGKEVRVRDMVSQLRKEYKKFKGKGMIELHEEP